jgi:hypothetical protein
MSPSHPDTAFRSKRPAARDLSAPHLRALRKELLLVRADVERMELAQATVDLRQAVTHFSWLKFIVPGFAGMRWGKARTASAGIGSLLKEYPLISSIASMLLAKPLPATVGSVSHLATDEERVAPDDGRCRGRACGLSLASGGRGRLVTGWIRMAGLQDDGLISYSSRRLSLPLPPPLLCDWPVSRLHRV